MKKTNNFNSMVDELFKSFFGDNVQFTTSCSEQDKEKCKCEHCNCDKEEPKSTKQVFEWTDDDFISEEAVVEYCEQLDSLVDQFQKVDSWLNISKLFGFDFIEYVDQLKEQAWDVYDKYVEDNTPESLEEDVLVEDDESESNTTQNLAERYVNEVIKAKFTDFGYKLDDKTAERLVNSYKDFADWVLDQH